MYDNMRISRRHFTLGALALAAQMGFGSVKAQGVISTLVGFPAGGAIDTTARVYANAMKGFATFVVENRVGATGNIAAGSLAKSRLNGNTIMFAPVNVYSISQSLYTNLQFNVSQDFAPVGLVAQFPWALAVHPDVPANNLSELIAWFKKNPEKAICGMGAIGSEGHMMAYVFSKVAGVPFNFAPYKGGAPMAQDLMAGHIPMGFDPIVNLVQPHKAGRLKILAITSQERSSLLEDVPVFSELGFPLSSGNTWIGVSVRKGTDEGRINQLSSALNEASMRSDVREKLAVQGLVTLQSSPEAMRKAIEDDAKRYASLIQEIGLKIT